MGSFAQKKGCSALFSQEESSGRPSNPLTHIMLFFLSNWEYIGGYYTDRRGRQREKWYSRCKRCGTSDGGEVFREGLLERITWRRFCSAVADRFLGTQLWWRTDCWDCKRPIRRFGRKIGDHENCRDDIPF